jgi:hypothetical protein
MRNVIIIIFLVFSKFVIAQSESFIITIDDLQGKNKIECIKYNNIAYRAGDTIYLDSTLKLNKQHLEIKIDKKLYMYNLSKFELVQCDKYKIKIVRWKLIRKSKFCCVLVLCDGQNILSGLPRLR